MLTARLLRQTAAVVLLTFGGLVTQPAVAALRAPANPLAQLKKAPHRESAESKYGQDLDSAAELADAAVGRLSQGQNPEAETQALLSVADSLQGQETDVDAEFEAVDAHLQAHKLPPEIRQRQRDAVAAFQQERSRFKTLVASVKNSRDPATRDAKLRELATYLDARQKKPQGKLDPEHLPFRNPEAQSRPPIETEAGFHNKANPRNRAAGSLSGFTLPDDTLPATPTAEDLAATEDAQLTDAIKAQAQALNHNPVAIHNWVRNSIEFIPSYGSIQGADATLQSKRGNAFDTASLEIALLRASGIPARYVYGTIRIPIGQAMNWLGGLTDADAALSLLATGGIPSTGLVSGGQVRYVQMEHVWVEAYVDYVPSRGAVNRIGDTWVPLDPSYKQYTYSQGMDLQTAVPLDAQSLLTQAQAGATVDEAQGWVQNLNQANVQTALNRYQTQLQTYIDNLNPNATVGDVLGGKTINKEEPAILLGSLPFKTIAVGSRFDTIPDNLRHKFQYSLYTDSYQLALENPIFSYRESLPKLAGKKVTLSFAAASQADADTLASYLPKPHADGSPIQPEELPTSLPAYLIHVTAQLRVDGELVASGGTFPLGQALLGQGGFTRYGLNGWDLSTDYTLISGQATAIGLSLQGITPGQLQTLKTRMEGTKARLEAGDYTGLTGDDLTGDLLTATVWSYFATQETLGTLGHRQADMIDLPALSYGLFHAKVKPSGMFGLVTSVSFPGLLMDIGHLRSLRIAEDNDRAKWVAYNRLRGMQASALEAAVPEQFWANPSLCGTACPKGVSAVTALGTAAQEGQKIFTITQATQAVALPQLSGHSQGVMDEVRNALAAGKEVTISEKPITTADGWKGTGYVIVDPQTGGGAYLIDGGANGGDWPFVRDVLAGGAAFVGLFFLTTGAVAVSGGAVFLLATLLAVMVVLEVVVWMADGMAHDVTIGALSGAAASFGETFVTLMAAAIAGAAGVVITMPMFITVLLFNVIFGAILAYLVSAAHAGKP